MLLEDFGRCSPAEGLAGAVVEGVGDGFEVSGAPAGQVGALGEVLTQRPVDASMSSCLSKLSDLIGPDRPVVEHGSVHDVDQVSLEDATCAAGAFAWLVACE